MNQKASVCIEGTEQGPLQIVPIDLQDWLESPGGADIPVRFMATSGTDAPRPDSGIAYSALND